MKAVILAAGEGKRLRPFTETIPKVMLPVANKPVLEYVIDAVKNNGINEIVIVVGYKKEVIMEHFKNYKGVKISYVIQEKQLGTGHALLHAKSHIKDTFIVLSGDNIIDNKSISKIIKDDSKFSILIKEHPDSSKYGAVFIEREKLREIVEKPKQEIGKFISTGIYKLPNTIFKKIEELASQGVYDLSSTIQSVIEEGEEINTILADLWRDIVYPWDIIQLNDTMIHRTPSSLGGTIEKGVTIKNDVSVGKGSIIYSGCYIVGPVIIGEGCEIGPNVCIFPSTTIGNNSVVQPFSQVGNTVIMNDVHIGSGSVIKNSIIGRGCIIENNFSSTDGVSTIEIEGEFKKLEKIGSMIGEDCNIGSNVVIESGKIIGRKCNISSLKIIGDNVPSNTKVM
jgi:glucose-1-phosphate thymidylyltransferase